MGSDDAKRRKRRTSEGGGDDEERRAPQESWAGEWERRTTEPSIACSTRGRHDEAESERRRRRRRKRRRGKVEQDESTDGAEVEETASYPRHGHASATPSTPRADAATTRRVDAKAQQQPCTALSEVEEEVRWMAGWGDVERSR